MLTIKTDCNVMIKSMSDITGDKQKAPLILEIEMFLNHLGKIHLKESKADVYLRFHLTGGFYD